MRKQFIFILVLFSLFVTSIKGKSQTLKITNVSVINSLGYVRITWEYNGSDDLGIFRDSLEIDNLSPLTVITDHSVHSFIDNTAHANERPRAYKIQSATNNTIYSDIVSTFYLSYSYDSCLQQINLQWDDLKFNSASVNEWSPSQFIINKVEDGITQKININPEFFKDTLDDILDNTNYKIFIETKWQGHDSTSYSNPINLFTEMLESPDYINAISASVDGNNTNLQFEIAPNSEINTYKLLKAGSPTGTFDTLETFVTTDSEISATDKASEPDTKESYYKLVSVNECGNETTNSDIINNILLKVENNDYVNTLSWNSFKENSHISIDYEVYRIVGDSDPELIGNFSNYNSFKNDIESIQNYIQFCYYVKAKEIGASDYSQSNIACVYLKPKVYIPEAFTPNDDGLNDLFQPVFAFVPKEFELRIYNRWGNLVFQTGDYTQAWDGKEPNGKPAPAGSYIYYIKITSPNGQIVEKRGNITVIYP